MSEINYEFNTSPVGTEKDKEEGNRMTWAQASFMAEGMQKDVVNWKGEEHLLTNRVLTSHSPGSSQKCSKEFMHAILAYISNISLENHKNNFYTSL